MIAKVTDLVAANKWSFKMTTNGRPHKFHKCKFHTSVIGSRACLEIEWEGHGKIPPPPQIRPCTDYSFKLKQINLTDNSVRNNSRSTATRPAALWWDQRLFVSAGPGDQQLRPHLSNYHRYRNGKPLILKFSSYDIQKCRWNTAETNKSSMLLIG